MAQIIDFPVLLLGPESCGKSLLLKSLQYFAAHDGSVWDFGSIPRHGRPTVGVDMVNFNLPLIIGDSKKRTARKRQNASITVIVRELGGQMAPLWPTYFDSDQCRGLIYCIDGSNPFQASRAAVELVRVLCNSKLRDTVNGILILFTKSADFETGESTNGANSEISESSSSDGRMSVTELSNMMLLDDILDEAKRNFKSIDVITRCSAVTGVGLADVFAWMERAARG